MELLDNNKSVGHIDAETGLLLRSGIAEVDVFHEWTELTTGLILSDDQFEWTATDRLANRYE